MAANDSSPSKALIVRSASFQQLDQNLPKIMEAFPQYHFNLLTHEHGVKLAEKYRDLNEIICYSFSESFSVFRREPKLNGVRYDAVIVPVSNLTGAGFLNVFFFSFSIKAKKRYICNMVSEVSPLRSSAVVGKGILSFLNNVSAGIVTVLSYPLLWLIVPRMLHRMTKGDRGGGGGADV